MNAEQITLYFAAPTPPLSTNAANALHWAKRTRELTPWKESAYYTAKQAQGLGYAFPDPAEVQLCIPFTIKRKRDPSNYIGTVVKAAVDGLVLARVWPDDDPRHVTILEPLLCMDTAMVEIRMTPRREP